MAAAANLGDHESKLGVNDLREMLEKTSGAIFSVLLASGLRRFDPSKEYSGLAIVPEHSR
jgi:hypothetical protein